MTTSAPSWEAELGFAVLELNGERGERPRRRSDRGSAGRPKLVDRGRAVAVTRDDEPVFVRGDDGQAAVVDTELHEDPLHVGLHRLATDREQRGDLLIGPPVRHQHQHLALPLGQLCERRGGRVIDVRLRTPSHADPGGLLVVR